MVHLIDTCLAKDPDQRRQNMHDVLLEVRWIAAGGSQVGIPKPLVARRKRQEQLAWAVVCIAAAAALGFGFLYWRQSPAPVYPIRFEQPVPKGSENWRGAPAVSPDGRSFAYFAAGAGNVLWVRRLDALQPSALPGTEDGRSPFWSPDSRHIAFIGADDRLRKIDVNGGPPQILCEFPEFAGGTWNREGVIVLGKRFGPLHQLSSTGGEPKPLLQLDATRKEASQFSPHFLPDGRHFVYSSISFGSGTDGVYLGSIGSQETRRLLDVPSVVSFVSPDLMLFVRGQTLMAQPIDSSQQRSGEPFPVADEVARSPVSQLSYFASSPNGTLVYRPAGTAMPGQPAWYNRDGKRLGAVGEARAYRQGTLSPDERRFAAQISDSTGRAGDLWLLDLTSGILSRLTSGPGNKDTVVWSPDGREILYSSNKTGTVQLYRKLVGGGDEQLVQGSSESNYPAEWLKDGSITYMNPNGRSFYRVAPGAGAKPETLLKTDYSKDGLRVSPDGRWAAYNTNESGRHEVYIAAFPSFAERRQVSNKGGVQGYWRKDGKELFYLSLEGEMVSVPIKPGTALEAGIPRVLFSTNVTAMPQFDQFAVTGDGQRFLVIEVMQTEAKPWTVVVNLLSGLKR